MKKEKRLRLSVFRSNKYIYAQIIDDERGETLVSSSDIKMNKKPVNEKRQKSVKTQKIERARLVGEELAKKALKKGIKRVWFDRGRYKYHGRVKVLAEGARKGGLEF